jgi:RNA ligase
MIHAARTIPFDVLWNGLQAAVDRGHVRTTSDDTGLHLFCYTDACVYDRAWDEFTLLARGVILGSADKKVMATPFPKFFNVGEGQHSIPAVPFETFEKLDGSLIIIFNHQGKWRTATKGSLNSDQAQWAAKQLAKADLSKLVPGVTYLCEAIYPENRIVVHYPYEGLVLLAAYHEDGHEFTTGELLACGALMDWRVATRYAYSSVAELLEVSATLPASEEGFVIRFENGLRLKVKGDEYCRIHRLVSNLTPLAMWDALLRGDNLEAVRRDLPEEFWNDFDEIVSLLRGHALELLARIIRIGNSVEELSDKDVGLRLETFPNDVRRFVFPYRKHKGNVLQGRTRETFFKEIRPTGNRLDGYRPSSSVNRVMEELAA